jgi:hypothetical protein
MRMHAKRERERERTRRNGKKPRQLELGIDPAVPRTCCAAPRVVRFSTRASMSMTVLAGLGGGGE